jgi:hypothetical protein
LLAFTSLTFYSEFDIAYRRCEINETLLEQERRDFSLGFSEHVVTEANADETKIYTITEQYVQSLYP